MSPARQIILFLASDPSDQARLRQSEEHREIHERLRAGNERDRFQLETRLAVRARDVRQAILDLSPNIVHFAGHGEGDGGLVFEDFQGSAKLVDTGALAGLFELVAENVQCVVLNACYSEVQAKAISEHIQYVIGMSKAVGDPAAIAFSTGFYQALSAGKSFEQAFKFGVNNIQMEGIKEFTTPVLLKGPVQIIVAENSTSPLPAELSFGQKGKLIELFLACPCLSNSGSRQNVITNLPGEINKQIQNALRANSKEEMSAILDACLLKSNGLVSLLEIVRFYDKGTIPISKLENYLKELNLAS